MDMFEKAKEVSGEVINSAKSFGNSLYSSSKEQSEIANLNVQKSIIKKRLKDSYAKIGEKYVDYIQAGDVNDVFNVEDILEDIKPDLEKLADLDIQINDKQIKIKADEEQKNQKKALAAYEYEKQKLDKALEMDIISEAEYDEKLSIAKLKMDNYELLRKVKLQLEMGIINKDEYDEKIKNILSN